MDVKETDRGFRVMVVRAYYCLWFDFVMETEVCGWRLWRPESAPMTVVDAPVMVINIMNGWV